MKLKKLISGIAALAVASSTFAGLTITVDAAAGDVTTILNEAFTSGSVTNPADSSYTWGTDLSGNLTTSGLLLTNANAANNNYTDRALVSFAEAKGDSTHKIDISYNVAYQSQSKGQAYTNYTMSYYNASGKLMFSITESIGSWADKASITYAETNSSTKEVQLPATHIAGAAAAEVTYDTEGGYLSIDGTTYKFITDSGIKDIKLTVSGGQDYNRGIYVKNYKMTSTEVEAVSYKTVTYSVVGNTSTETVVQGKTVDANAVPDTTNLGYTFKGWYVNDDTSKIISTDELKAYVVNEDVTFTAVYEEDRTYVEKIVSAEIDGASSMTLGPDPDTAADNAYSVVLTGEKGTVITEDNLSALVTDFNVKWDIEGFATENDTAGQYCDSYGAFTKNNTGSVSTVFALKNVPMNFFGKMTATVTYNGTTYTASKYVAALGNTTVASNQILPAGGYPSVFNNYPDSLIDYKATVSGNNQSGTDVITGNFFIAGSDDSREAKLLKDEDGTKYFRVTKNTASKSDMFAHTISVNDSQVIYEQKMRFNASGNKITFTRGYPTWSTSSGYAEIASFEFDGAALKLAGAELKNGENTAQIQTDTWYNIVLSVDPSSGKAYAKAYTMDGTLVGEVDNVALVNKQAPTYYAIGTDNSKTGTVDFAGYSVYYPIADTNNYTLTASQDTLSIPNGDTADLAASLKTSDGYDLTGVATWSVLEEDMQAGVIVTADENDSHKAKVTLTSEAAAGEATVQVDIGGYTKTIVLNITSSAESVKFTKSSTSVSIPLDDTPITAEYAAVVVNGEGADLGRNTILAVYDKNNTAEYTLPAGISFDAATGTLTVLKTALPCTFTIRATGANTDGEAISKAVKVTVHGLAFDFGTTTDDAVAEGYTPVGADTRYTAARGYGIKSGTVAAEGSASIDNADSDYLAGAFEFDANVTAGKVYTVEITYSGTLKTAYVNSDLAGYTLGNHKEMTSETYTLAVPTDILDLTVSAYVDDKGTEDESDDERFAPSIASITVTKNADRTARTKPVIHQIGDSTAANNGSWAYHIDHNRSSFPTLDALATFHNDGAGGRNLCSYYTEGKLASVLNDIYPGDIVMFGNNGTNGLGNYFETDVNYYLDAAEIMGAKIIINSYTPHGAVGNEEYVSKYNSSTHTFDSWRKDDSGEPTTRKVAEERAASDPNYLGFVEIGKNADLIFNAYVADYAKNGYASADEAAQAIISCFSDHNHYNNNGLARDLMLNGYEGCEAKGIVEQIVDILSNEDPTLTPTPTATAATDPTPTATATTDPTPTATTDPGMTTVYAADAVVVAALYDANGALTAIESITPVKENQEVLEFPADVVGQKVFVWDSLENMKPVGTKQIPKPEATTDPGEAATPDPGEEATEDPGEAATPDPEKEAKVIWKAAQNTEYTAGQTLADGLELVFGTAEGATPVYADFTVSDTDTTPTTKLIGGVLFTGYVSATTANGSWSGTSIDPAKPTAIKYTASKTGVLTVYLDSVGTTKKICVGQEDDKKEDIEAAATMGTGEAMAFEYGVTAGQSYYIYVAGSKGRFCGVAFDENGEVEPPAIEPPTEPEIPAPKENEWAMSADYLNDCVAGTELMVGLTTLFDNTSTNKAYLSGAENGSFSSSTGVATGTALKYAASKNGKLAVSFVDLGTPSSDGSPKTMYIVEEGTTQDDALATVANDTTEKLNGTIEANVEAGKTYYIYGRGTKARFSGAAFTAE